MTPFGFLLGEQRPQNRTNADEIYFARMVHRWDLKSLRESHCFAKLSV